MDYFLFNFSGVQFHYTMSLEKFLQKWSKKNSYLMDTCLAAQDRYKAYLDYFRIEYD